MGTCDPWNVAPALPLSSTSTPITMFANDVFMLAMLIKVSMPHVTGSIAPMTAQRKPMLRKKNMKLLLVMLALNIMVI